MYNNQAATLMKKVSFIYDRPIDPISDFGLCRGVSAQIIGKIKGLFFVHLPILQITINE